MRESLTVLYVCDGSDKEGMRMNFDADLDVIKATTGGVCTSWNPADARNHLVSGFWSFDLLIARSSIDGWSGAEFIDDVNNQRAAKGFLTIPGYAMGAELYLTESTLRQFLNLVAEKKRTDKT